VALRCSKGPVLQRRRLSDAEKESILRWVAAGAPKGNVKTCRRSGVYGQLGDRETRRGNHDARAVHCAASGVIAYQNFTVPTNFTEDKWVQAIEVRPGARSVVQPYSRLREREAAERSLHSDPCRRAGAARKPERMNSHRR